MIIQNSLGSSASFTHKFTLSCQVKLGVFERGTPRYTKQVGVPLVAITKCVVFTLSSKVGGV